MSDDSKPATKAEPLTVICGDCGEVIELKDPHAYILAVHLGMNCPSTASLREPG